MIRIKNSNPPRLPSEYQEVEYIESSGTQYIDTGFIPNQNSSIEMIVKFNDLTINETLYCSRESTSSSSLTCFKVASALRVDYEKTKQTLSNFTLNATTKYTFYANKNQFYINGELKHTFTSTTVSTPDTWAIMVARNNGASYSNYGKYKLYSCRIWDNDTLVRDFVPCYRTSDNVAGLYDLVNSAFYTNAGTGTFLIGTEVNKRDVNIHPTPGGKTLLEKYIENLLVYKNGSSYIDTEFISCPFPTSWATVTSKIKYSASNEYGEWVIESSGSNSTSYAVDKVFDGNTSSRWYYDNESGEVSITPPKPIKPKNISIKYGFSSIVLMGLNASTNEWETLYSNQTKIETTQTIEESLSTDNYYTQFKIGVELTSADYSLQIYEFQITSGTIRQEG